VHLAIGRLKLGLVLADLGIALAANCLAALFRFGWPFSLVQAWGGPYLLPTLLLVVLLWPLVLQWQGAYQPLRLKTAWAEAGEVLRAGLVFAATVLAMQALLHAYQVSRLFLILLFLWQVALTLLSRLAVHRLLAWARRAGRNARRLLIVGAGPEGRRILADLQGRPELGLRVVGFVDDRSAERLRAVPGAPLLGRMADLPRILREQVVDEVLVSLPFSTFDRVQKVLAACNQEGKNVYLAVDGLAAARGAVARSRLAEVNGVPFLGLIYAPDHVPALAAKRVTDLLVSGVVLLALSPLLLLIALLVRLDSPGPAIFRQRRVGLHGRVFTLYKFRTMVIDAEERLVQFRQRNEIRGPAFKLRDDPRVTRVGRWLRRLSLDELPQLWNVLRGDMSLVGPRPPLPREVAEYDGWHRRRLSVRPGLTGPWQVAGRNDLPEFDRWVELELEYIDHWSFWLDLKILLRTIPEVFALHGR
jgi:exopolysaccharide biosynthesis polyprenyl glycosylphosphotransferase